jgi:translation initiation factor 2 beta subunit (eIF-2beta)/eIF-5
MESFDDMLDNLYSNLEFKNSSLKIVLTEPILIKSGQKTIWKNVKEYLKLFDRDPEHFIDFINTDTATKVFWLTDSKSDGCLFQNKTKKDYVFEIMKKYIKTKVLCKNCQSIDTKLIKNKELRKYQLCCVNCKSEYFT